MNRSKRGLSSIAKIGLVVVIIVLVVSGIYLAPSLLGGSKPKSVAPGGGASGGTQTFGLLQLFRYFSQVQLRSALFNPSGSGGTLQEETFSYVVLGNASFQGTPNVKVEFSTVGGQGDNIVGWFNSSGIIDRLDIIGGTNYTGPAAAILGQTYASTFASITTETNNATLFSLLTKTSENMTNVGSTQLDVSTYHLAARSPVYSNVTAQYATIPGTYQKVMIYLDEKMRSGTETTFQISSLKSSS